MSIFVQVKANSSQTDTVIWGKIWVNIIFGVGDKSWIIELNFSVLLKYHYRYLRFSGLGWSAVEIKGLIK